MRKLYSKPLFLAFLIGFFSFLVLRILKINIQIEEDIKKSIFLEELFGIFTRVETEITENEQQSTN